VLTVLGAAIGVQITALLTTGSEDERSSNEADALREQLQTTTTPKALGPGWGPERTVYRDNARPAEPTLNSVVDLPHYGDERNGALAKDAARKTAGGFADTVRVQPGREYLVRMLVANDSRRRSASSTGTRVRASVPADTGRFQEVGVSVFSDNARPALVHDSVILVGAVPINVAYVGGSASFFNGANLSRAFGLPDSMVTSTGALVGETRMDGIVPGGLGGLAVFRVKVYGPLQAGFTVDADVRRHPIGGDKRSRWSASLRAAPGDLVDILLTFRNTGHVPDENVVARIGLPSGLTYVPGSTTLTNTTNPRGRRQPDSVTGAGTNIGGYAPSGAAYVRLTARVRNSTNLPFCGNNSLGVAASVNTDHGQQHASAVINTRNDCE